MRRMVLNAALGRTTRARRDPERALANWRTSAEEIAAAADIEPDTDDNAFSAELGFLLQCLARVPDLTPVGWNLRLEDAELRYENRLRVKWIHANNPLVAAEPVDRPVFIVGLPRTATALVHRLLSRTEGHRGPLLWELQRTGLDHDPLSADRAREAVARRSEALRRLSPAYDSIQPVHAEQPGESSAVMWRTYLPLACAPMQEYRTWLEQTDPIDDYTYLRQVLQVLQYGRPRKRWILRFPGHVAHLDVIRQVFPQASFVWMHRDPATALASFCSLAEALTTLHCKAIDPKWIGRTWLGILADAIARGRKHRRALPESAVVDVSYHRLVSDPHRFVPQVYERLGAAWAYEDQAGLNDLIGPAGRESAHQYSLERYGLSAGEVEAAFDDALEVLPADRVRVDREVVGLPGVPAVVAAERGRPGLVGPAGHVDVRVGAVGERVRRVVRLRIAVHVEAVVHRGVARVVGVDERHAQHHVQIGL
ncbi:sulfotransferase [Glycomyces sp. NPDC046736]|uniref:sulfotransferase family protein n=1 Tax=Glycomyces sp. NPDC046736 TaxID=3155615 RepID=UPI0034032764